MNNNVRDFRRLRRRKDNLEREIYDYDAIVRMSRNTPQPDDASARSAEYGYILENQARQEEVDEINYVLDYFERLAHTWSTRSQLLLVAIVAIVAFLTAFAVMRLV